MYDVRCPEDTRLSTLYLELAAGQHILLSKAASLERAFSFESVVAAYFYNPPTSSSFHEEGA
jgi:hypothetical protein